jgi:hypothetical protein
VAALQRQLEVVVVRAVEARAPLQPALHHVRGRRARPRRSRADAPGPRPR